LVVVARGEPVTHRRISLTAAAVQEDIWKLKSIYPMVATQLLSVPVVHQLQGTLTDTPELRGGHLPLAFTPSLQAAGVVMDGQIEMGNLAVAAVVAVAQPLEVRRPLVSVITGVLPQETLEAVVAEQARREVQEVGLLLKKAV